MFEKLDKWLKENGNSMLAISTFALVLVTFGYAYLTYEINQKNSIDIEMKYRPYLATASYGVEKYCDNCSSQVIQTIQPFLVIENVGEVPVKYEIISASVDYGLGEKKQSFRENGNTSIVAVGKEKMQWLNTVPFITTNYEIHFDIKIIYWAITGPQKDKRFSWNESVTLQQLQPNWNYSRYFIDKEEAD